MIVILLFNLIIHNMKYQWTIIYVDFQHRYLHLNHIQKSNPDAQIILCDISNDISKIIAWRNNDRFIRDWLKKNKNKIIHNNIAIVEWDVLITSALPNILVDGFVGRNLQKPGINKWLWFKEIDRLGKYKNYATGAAPFAIQFFNKNAIDVWTSEEFNDIFLEDIFCELRLPTIMNYANINISEHLLPYVEWYPAKYNKDVPGIYHAIKYKIDDN